MSVWNAKSAITFVFSTLSFFKEFHIDFLKFITLYFKINYRNNNCILHNEFILRELGLSLFPLQIVFALEVHIEARRPFDTLH